MKLVNTFIGIQWLLQIASVFGISAGKNKQHSKQFTLSCTGMDYSARQQRMRQNDNDISSDSFTGIYPEGQEVLYSYFAVVTTGTKFPAPFVSQFNLTGNIKVQGFKNKARVQFLNLKYIMYSGDFLAEKKLKIAKLPESSATLYEPFDIFYKDGQVSKLEMTPGTPLWSKSIKQALSGILQLDLRKINTEKFTSFVSTEQSIHGNCAVLYSVKPQKNKLLVTKFYSTDDCQRESAEWSNVETAHGCLHVESEHDKLESFSQKTYRVTPYSDDTLLIREVFSEGKTYKFLNQNSNSSHFITVSQKLQLVSMNGISRVVDISNPQEIDTLEYDVTQFNSFKFSTNEDLKHVEKKVLHLLPAVRAELEGKNSLLSERINRQESHLIPLLITYLRKLDMDSFKQIYNELEGKNHTLSIDMFTSILPQVGSIDSALFLVYLVKESKAVNCDAEMLVSALPFHIRQLSEDHLTDFEDLLHLPESTSNAVKNAAVLSFATLVYKTCQFERCSPEIIEKYTIHYIENSNEYLKQLVYLAGLSNLHLENIVDFLEPIISGEEPVSSESIRVFGLRAVYPVIAANPSKAYEIYWPVLINRENSLELRANALVWLMEAQQDSSVYMQLHQIMTAKETCIHLYNIYYKLMKSYSEEKDFCHLTRTHIALKLMRSMKKPVISQFPSSHYTFSIADGELKVLTIVNPLSEDGISVYITFSSKTTMSPVTYYSIYIKLKGIDVEVLNNILHTIFDSSRAEDVLKTLIKNKLIPENFQLDFILFSQLQVISLRNYNRNNIEDLIKDLIDALQVENSAKFSWLHATSLFNMETFFVTDIGFPGVLSLDFPTLISFHSQKATDDSTPVVDIDTYSDLRYWSQGSTVLKVKNTMVDIWQGIINSHASRFNFPMNYKLILENKLNLQVKPTPNKDNNYTGFKWHTQTDIFTVTNSENYDALSISCQECKSLASVKNKIAQNVERELHNNGYSLYRKIFDCEDDGTANLLKSILNFNSPNLIHTLGTVLSAGFFLEKNLLELPISGSCGYSTVYTANQGFNVCVESTFRRNNLSLLIGSSGALDEECVPDNVMVSLSIEGSSDSSYDKDKLMGECKRKLAAGFEEKLKEQFKGKVSTCGITKSNGHADNLEWCEKEMKPQIMNCLQTEMVGRNQEKVIKFDIKVSKFPKAVEQSVHLLINDYMEAHSENTSSKGAVGTKYETEATVIVNLGKSKCSLNLHSPARNFVFNDIPIN